MPLKNNDDKLNLSQFSSNAYLNYAMNVILDRSIPHISDGLKPVQRRIIYAMSEMGISAKSKYKKSARTVGDVLGKYHPHGDSACYEAMVLMAQDFTSRYPLIDGQGNWGSIDDPKSFAAMRYTESRLSSYAHLLLDELKQATVEWIPNFDGTLNEPALLPAQLPNLLLNGSSGIAVGMATNVPPHNLNEVVNACLSLLKHPDISEEKLSQDISAPDFPGGCEIITPYHERIKAYQQGNGPLKLRAIYHREDNNIVITKLPHQTSSSKIIEQIANIIQYQKISWLKDVRDESDYKEYIRIVIEPSSKCNDIDRLMSHLFAITNLEIQYQFNFNILGLDKKPRVRSLKEILEQWLNYRKNTVIKRTKYKLQQVEQRLHILEGLLIAYFNLNIIIEIIRNEKKPEKALIYRFNITSQQAEAILETKLKNLVQMEETKIKYEQSHLINQQKRLKHLLNDDQALNKQVIKELKNLKKAYGDERRCPIQERAKAASLSENELNPSEKISIIISKLGWIKSAKGHISQPERLYYRAGDAYLDHINGESSDQILCVANDGKVFTLATSSLPSAKGQGQPLTRFINIKAYQYIRFIKLIKHDQRMIFILNTGYGFITDINTLNTQSKSGKQLIKMTDKDQLLKPVLLNYQNDLKDYYLALITNYGRCLIIKLKELPLLNRGKGNQLIKLEKRTDGINEMLTHFCCFYCNELLILRCGGRYKKIDSKERKKYLREAGLRGIMLSRGFRRVSECYACEVY